MRLHRLAITGSQLRFLASSARPKPSRLGATISLDHFLQRGRVLALWRQVLRGTKRIPQESAKREVRDMARAEFERNRAVTDITQIRYLISTGKTQWEEMERFINM